MNATFMIQKHYVREFFCSIEQKYPVQVKIVIFFPLTTEGKMIIMD